MSKIGFRLKDMTGALNLKEWFKALAVLPQLERDSGQQAPVPSAAAAAAAAAT